MSEPETVSDLVDPETVQAGPAPVPRPPAAVAPSITDHALRFDHVSMVFPDGTHAVEDVSLDLRPGEFVTIVGPSGCGKSTLLRIASGLETNTSGTVFVLRKSLGYVFQDATLLPWRTVGKNIELLAELQGVDKAARARLVKSTVDLVGLQGFENKYPKQLSGGMRMRASLARSLVLEPEGVPVRRAVRRARRDHPGTAQRRAAPPVPARGLRGALHHPLHHRGGLPLDAGGRDVGPARAHPR